MNVIKRTLKRLLFSASLLCFSTFACAKTGNLKISGILLDGITPISGSIVQIYSQESLIVIAKTDNFGRFDFELELNREYLTVFSCFGYVTKRILINTNVRKNEEKTWSYSFRVDLFPELFEIDYSTFIPPVSVIKYYPNYDEFDFDVEYDNKIRLALMDLSNLVKKRRYGKYQQYMSEANKELKDKNYIKAMDYYIMANVCNPSANQPYEGMTYIDEIASKTSEKYKRYLELNDLGDSCLLTYSFNKASVFFSESLVLYPKSDYSMYKKNLSDTLASKFDNIIYRQIEYKKYLTLANSCMNKGLFDRAFINYCLALKIDKTDELVYNRFLALKSQFNFSESDYPEIKFEQIMNEAYLLLKDGNNRKALQKYIEAQKIKPDDQFLKIQIERMKK